VQPPPGYHDTAVPRVAGEGAWALGPVRLAARLGYFFEPSPAPREAPTLVDADRHALTGGAALQWKWGALDAFAQWHHLAGSARAGGDFAVFGATFGVDL
jgi:hypothetical protein